MSRFLTDPPRDEDREPLPVLEFDATVIADSGAAEATVALAEVGADPNLDLIGYEIPGVGTVVRTAPWSEQYVQIETGETPAVTCRPVGLVRAQANLARSC